jgi:signal transduction histidine kinase
MNSTLSREQGLLTASGLAAIAVVAWVLWLETGRMTTLGLNLLFAGVFVAASLDRILRRSVVPGRPAILLLVALAGLELALFPYQVVLILMVVVAATAPYHLSARESWLLLLLGNGLYAGLLVMLGRLPGELPGLFSLLALQAFAISSSLARRREETAKETLAAQNEELQAARAVLARQSQAEERLRIAGDLHDSLGHRLTALQLQLEVLTHEAPEQLRRQLRDCKALAADLLEEVRAIVRRMPGDEPADLDAVLRDLAAATPGVSLEVVSAMPRMDAGLAPQLAYCLREAVHNAIRHGQADRIEISHAAGCLVIDDNGTGLQNGAVRPGFGLGNINLRLAPFGGHAVLEDAPGGCGCRLRLYLPGEHGASPP